MDEGHLLDGREAPPGRSSRRGACEVRPRAQAAGGGARSERPREALPRANLALGFPRSSSGASSPPSAAPRTHCLHSAAPASPILSLSFLALPFALPWSHLFTLPSLAVTHRSPSLCHSHPFCPLSLLPLTLHLSPGRLLRGLCRRRCCGPRGRGLLPREPSVHLCPLPGGAGGKFPPRPFPSDRTWRRPRPGRRREGRSGSRAPSPARELARSVSLSASAETRRRRRRRELGEDLH